MKSDHQIIHIQPLAPRKPAFGAVCNGCGVCCLAEPCPLGVVLSGRRNGPCAALHWQADQSVYRCGAVSQPAQVLQQRMPLLPGAMAQWLAPVLARLAKRWVAAGRGCDCSLEPQSRT